MQPSPFISDWGQLLGAHWLVAPTTLECEKRDTGLLKACYNVSPLIKFEKQTVESPGCLWCVPGT